MGNAVNTPSCMWSGVCSLGARNRPSTYVGVSSDLLDGLIIEVAGVAGKASANLVGVL